MIGLMILALAALTGGASRLDVSSLLILRPLSVLALVYVAFRYWGRAWERLPLLVLLASASILLVALHLVPLPPEFWSSLPLRAGIAGVYDDLGVDRPWLPLSLAPARTWNALFFLALPMAALLASAHLSSEHLRKIALAVAATALLSGFLGLMQVAGSPQGPLYFYDSTNNGAAVGLFANRNHNGLFVGMALPLLAVFWTSGASQHRANELLRRALIGIAALLACAMALLTGSRGALLTLGVAIAGSLFIYFTMRKDVGQQAGSARRGAVNRKLPQLALITSVATIVLAIAIAMFVRSTGFDRLVETDASQEMRLLALPIVLEMTAALMPVGGGAGSFESIYKWFEPLDLVGPQYLNHAHNDWLEILSDFGVPGLLLMGAGVILYAGAVFRLVRARHQSRRVRALGAAGATILAMIALLSVFDYPARVPLIAVAGIFAAVWLARAASHRNYGH